MKKISILLSSVLIIAITLYGYCSFKESVSRDKRERSRDMLYITMLDTLVNAKDGKNIIEHMLALSLMGDIEYIGGNSHSYKKNIYPICESWTQNTEKLIKQTMKQSIKNGTVEINSNFIKGVNIINDMCKK